jgi:alpha-glucoside transport system permease protein
MRNTGMRRRVFTKPPHLKNFLAPSPRLRPWYYVGPSLFLLFLFLLYPSIETIVLSFFGPNSHKFVGLANYHYAFTDSTMLISFRNNAIWLIIFTVFTVALGLLIAVLVDRVRYERVAKSIIFLPMAISMVGASVIWKFMYAFKPAAAPQIGLLNQILVTFGGRPIAWLIHSPWNNVALIAVGVWLWTGFCMVILSAALKNIPKQLLEAARIDGANEWQVFRKVLLPLLWPTATVVTTTMIVFVLKIFDIVYVMTNGAFNTDVIANLMYKQAFLFGNYGRASAISVILLLVIVPMMWINIRRFKGQMEMR